MIYFDKLSPYKGENRNILITSYENHVEIWVNYNEFENLRDSDIVYLAGERYVYLDDNSDKVYNQIGGAQYESWYDDWGFSSYEYRPSN